MLAGGTCGTLLDDLRHPLLFALGIVGTIFFVGFVFSSVVRANIPVERRDAD